MLVFFSTWQQATNTHRGTTGSGWNGTQSNTAKTSGGLDVKCKTFLGADSAAPEAYIAYGNGFVQILKIMKKQDDGGKKLDKGSWFQF